MYYLEVDSANEHYHDCLSGYCKFDNNILSHWHLTNQTGHCLAGIPANTLTSQGGMKCLVGGSLGLEEEVVDVAKTLEGVGELV